MWPGPHPHWRHHLLITMPVTLVFFLVCHAKLSPMLGPWHLQFPLLGMLCPWSFYVWLFPDMVVSAKISSSQKGLAWPLHLEYSPVAPSSPSISYTMGPPSGTFPPSSLLRCLWLLHLKLWLLPLSMYSSSHLYPAYVLICFNTAHHLLTQCINHLLNMTSVVDSVPW